MALSVGSIGGSEVNLQAGALVLPTDVRIDFNVDGVMTFGAFDSSISAAAGATSAVQWLDRGDISRDFQCAANWNLLIDGNATSNPSFIAPCSQQDIDLTSVGDFQLDFPSRF
jgi:hypothetical protein